jgi:hypothetical protein
MAALGRFWWERYTTALIARPLLVKGSTASFIFFVSDSVTQKLTEDTYNLARAGSGTFDTAQALAGERNALLSHTVSTIDSILIVLHFAQALHLGS